MSEESSVYWKESSWEFWSGGFSSSLLYGIPHSFLSKFATFISPSFVLKNDLVGSDRAKLRFWSTPVSKNVFLMKRKRWDYTILTKRLANELERVITIVQTYMSFFSFSKGMSMNFRDDDNHQWTELYRGKECSKYSSALFHSKKWERWLCSQETFGKI